MAGRRWPVGDLILAPVQQAEYDFNLVQPTGRRRCEVKPNSSLELRQSVVVSFGWGVVIQYDVDLFVRRLIGPHAIKETAKILPLLILRKLRLHLASADFSLAWSLRVMKRLLSA
jgi:hypothetical protein